MSPSKAVGPAGNILIFCGFVVAMIASYLAGRHMERESLPCPRHHFAIIGDSNVFAMDLGPNCVNLGNSGDTTKQMAERFDARLVAPLQKTLVVWTSTNDLHAGSKYGVTYVARIAEAARRAGMHVILTTPLPDDAYKTEGAAFAAKIHEYAAEKRYPVVDLYRLFQNPEGTEDISLFRRESNGSHIHLNSVGLARTFDALVRLIPD